MFPVDRRAVSQSTPVATEKAAAQSASQAKPALRDGRVKDDAYVPTAPASPAGGKAAEHRVFLPIVGSSAPPAGGRTLRDGRVRDDVYVPARSTGPFAAAPQALRKGRVKDDVYVPTRPGSPAAGKAAEHRVFLPIVSSSAPPVAGRTLRDGRVRDDVYVPARRTGAAFPQQTATLQGFGGGGGGGGTGGFDGPPLSFMEKVANVWEQSLLGQAYSKWRKFTEAHTPSWLKKANEVLALPPIRDAMSFGITPIGGWGFVGRAAQGAASLDETAAASRTFKWGGSVAGAQGNGALVYRGTNLAGAQFFGSSRPIGAQDVVDAVKALQSQGAREITVLTGTHGGAAGQIFRADTKELKFLIEDLRNVKGPNVRILDINLVTKSQLERMTGHVYAAWCTSEESEAWLEILEPAAR